MNVTCGRCLSGQHRRCVRIGCACNLCVPSRRPNGRTRRSYPKPRYVYVGEGVRVDADVPRSIRPRSGGAPKGSRNAAITMEDEAEIRLMVLKLVEGVARRIGVPIEKGQAAA